MRENREHGGLLNPRLALLTELRVKRSLQVQYLAEAKKAFLADEVVPVWMTCHVVGKVIVALAHRELIISVNHIVTSGLKSGRASMGTGQRTLLAQDRSALLKLSLQLGDHGLAWVDW